MRGNGKTRHPRNKYLVDEVPHWKDKTMGQYRNYGEIKRHKQSQKKTKFKKEKEK